MPRGGNHLPDATGLELIAQRVREHVGDDSVIGTSLHRGEGTLEVAPARLHDALAYLKEHDNEPWELLMSVHGCDYLPDEPRLGVHYQLLSRERLDRICVKTRVGVDEPLLRSVVDLFPTANHQEREVFDMFGVIFEGHPDLTRILMPEDYEGFPQRRDFPMGGEPVLFTFNEHEHPRWYD
jgi:NADH-quinone oxidoreductase subunit C